MTRAERLLRRIKNNKIVSVAIVFGVVVTAVATFTDAVVKLGRALPVRRILREPLSEPDSKVKLQVDQYQEFKRAFSGIYGPRKINYGTGGEGEVFVTVDVERRSLLLRGHAYQRSFDDEGECAANVDILDQIDLDSVYKVASGPEKVTAEAEYVFPISCKVEGSAETHGGDPTPYAKTVVTTGRLTVRSKVSDDVREDLTYITLYPPDFCPDASGKPFEVTLYRLDPTLNIRGSPNSNPKPD